MNSKQMKVYTKLFYKIVEINLKNIWRKCSKKQKKEQKKDDKLKASQINYNKYNLIVDTKFDDQWLKSVTLDEYMEQRTRWVSKNVEEVERRTSPTNSAIGVCRFAPNLNEWHIRQLFSQCGTICSVTEFPKAFRVEFAAKRMAAFAIWSMNGKYWPNTFRRIICDWWKWKNDKTENHSPVGRFTPNPFENHSQTKQLTPNPSMNQAQEKQQLTPNPSTGCAPIGQLVQNHICTRGVSTHPPPPRRKRPRTPPFVRRKGGGCKRGRGSSWRVVVNEGEKLKICIISLAKRIQNSKIFPGGAYRHRWTARHPLPKSSFGKNAPQHPLCHNRPAYGPWQRHPLYMYVPNGQLVPNGQTVPNGQLVSIPPSVQNDRQKLTDDERQKERNKTNDEILILPLTNRSVLPFPAPPLKCLSTSESENKMENDEPTEAAKLAEEFATKNLTTKERMDAILKMISGRSGEEGAEEEEELGEGEDEREEEKEKEEEELAK